MNDPQLKQGHLLEGIPIDPSPSSDFAMISKAILSSRPRLERAWLAAGSPPIHPRLRSLIDPERGAEIVGSEEKKHMSDLVQAMWQNRRPKDEVVKLRFSQVAQLALALGVFPSFFSCGAAGDQSDKSRGG